MKNFKSRLSILSALMLAWTFAAASNVAPSSTLNQLESMDRGNAATLDRGYDHSLSNAKETVYVAHGRHPVANVAPMIARRASQGKVREKTAEPKSPAKNESNNADFNKALGMFAGAIIGGALLASGGAAAGAVGALIGAAVGYFIARSMREKN